MKFKFGKKVEKDGYGKYVILRKGIRTYFDTYSVVYGGPVIERCEKHGYGWKEGGTYYCNECCDLYKIT
jgi:hypothetical protein